MHGTSEGLFRTIHCTAHNLLPIIHGVYIASLQKTIPLVVTKRSTMYGIRYPAIHFRPSEEENFYHSPCDCGLLRCQGCSLDIS